MRNDKRISLVNCKIIIDKKSLIHCANGAIFEGLKTNQYKIPGTIEGSNANFSNAGLEISPMYLLPL
jgi:hypothetical protein